MGFMDHLRNKYELYKLEQRYTRRDKRTTFASGAQYVDGEYVYSPTSSTKSGSGSFGGKRMSTVQVKEIFSSGGELPSCISTTPIRIAPFMPHQRGLVHAACTARNAYNPALAITSAFLPSANDALRFPPRSTAPHCLNASASTVGARYFASSRHAQDIRRGADRAEDGGHEGLQRQPAKKGTYAGYEALMDSFGSDATQNSSADPTKLAMNAMSAVHQSRPVRDSTRREPPPHEPARKDDVQVIRRVELDERRGGRGQRRKEYDNMTDQPDMPETGGRFARSASQTASWLSYPYAKDKRGRSSARSERNSPQASEDIEAPAAPGWKVEMRLLGEEANRLAQRKLRMSPAAFESAKKRMNYKGHPVPLEEPTINAPIPYPWAVGSGESSGDPDMGILNEEIRRFAKWVQPTAAETAARQSVVDQVHALVREYCREDTQCALFGSETSGLSTATSDLDFRLFSRKADARQNREHRVPTQIHRRLATEMREHPDWIAVVLRDARFPIINAQHRHTGIDVQIVASPSTQAQHETTLHCLNTIPNLKDLYLVLRAMLGLRGLADVFNGGTGSYGLLIMLVASLTRRGDTFTSPTINPGVQLLQFLSFYCAHYRPTRAIAVLPPTDPAHPPTTKTFPKHSNFALDRAAYIRAAYARADPVRAGQWSIGYRRPYQPYLLCVQDPANPLNDLGRKTNAIKHVVATFKAVRRDLRRGLFAAQTGRWVEGESVLAPAVGRCHEVLAGWRRRVEEYGVLELERREEREREARGRVGEAEGEGEGVVPERPSVVETAWAG